MVHFGPKAKVKSIQGLLENLNVAGLIFYKGVCVISKKLET